MNQIYIGNILEESRERLFGIVQDNETKNEYYVNSTPKKDITVIYQLKQIGPNNKITRAFNTTSLNEALERFNYTYKEFFKDPSSKYLKEEFIFLSEGIKLFFDNGILPVEENLSFVGKKGLNDFYSFLKLNNGVQND